MLRNTERAEKRSGHHSQGWASALRRSLEEFLPRGLIQTSRRGCSCGSLDNGEAAEMLCQRKLLEICPLGKGMHGLVLESHLKGCGDRLHPCGRNAGDKSQTLGKPRVLRESRRRGAQGPEKATPPSEAHAAPFTHRSFCQSTAQLRKAAPAGSVGLGWRGRQVPVRAPSLLVPWVTHQSVL